MPYLKPKSTLGTFDVSCKVSDGGNPYSFGICASIRGQFDVSVDSLLGREPLEVK